METPIQISLVAKNRLSSGLKLKDDIEREYKSLLTILKPDLFHAQKRQKARNLLIKRVI